jgi:hypothetical protein
MEVNIFDKIYQIMTTYENLLNQKKDVSSTNSFDVKNDPFFQFIFQNIHLSKTSSTFHSTINTNQDKKTHGQDEQMCNNQTKQFSHENSPMIKKNTLLDTPLDIKNHLEKETKKDDKNQKNEDKKNQKNEQENNHDQKQDNEQNKNSSSNTNNFSSNDETKDLENPTQNKNDVNFEVKKYMKSCYKKIILLCHPDKTKEYKELYQEYFIKCQEYYENNFMIGLLYLFYLLKLKPPSLSSLIVNHIIIEIRHIQEKINELKNE